MAVLHVVCVNANGLLTHTIRRLDGTWFPFGDVKRVVLGQNPGSPNPGKFEHAACAGVQNDLHVCGLTPGGGIDHTIRAIAGNWPSGFRNVRTAASAPTGAVFSISAAALGGQLRVGAAIKSTTGSSPSAVNALYTAIRNSLGAWDDFQNRGGSFTDVALGQANGELHFCGITFDRQGITSNRLEHALLSGASTPFRDIRPVVLAQNPGSFDPGTFGHVSCAGIDRELHVCAISNGRLIRTSRRANGGFSPFTDVVTEVLAGNPGTPAPSGFGSVSCAGVNRELHIAAVDQNGVLWHTVRRANGTLVPFGDVRSVVLGQNPGTLNPGAIASVSVADSF